MRDFLDCLSLQLEYTNILKKRVNLHSQGMTTIPWIYESFHGIMNHSMEYEYDVLQDNLPKGEKNCDYNMANC